MVKSLKLSLLAMAMIAGGSANAQTQIANGDFETWTYDGVNLPNNWNSFQTFEYTSAVLKSGYNASNRQIKQSKEVRPGTSGKYSTVIWCRTIMTVPAQGNLTTGRIHAGSAKAADASNYNYTSREQKTTNNGIDNPYAMAFTGKPDSIVAWVKFKPAKVIADYPTAKFSAIIHDDHDYISYGLPDNDTEVNKGYVVASAVQPIESKGAVWQRISIPFEYTSNTNAQYIQINASTNAYPGKGTAGDSLYIDDIECAYNKTYTEPLYVTINGETTAPVEAKVDVTEYSKTFNLSLRKFGLDVDGDFLPVGDIVVTDLTADEDGNFAFSGNIILQDNEELIDEYGYCMGSDICTDEETGELVGIPVSISGKLLDGKILATIDIDLMDKIGQIISVHLGYDKANANMTITDAQYATFCAPMDVELPEGVKAYSCPQIGENNELVLEQVTGNVLPANTPVILEGAEVCNEDYVGFVESIEEKTTCGLLTGVYAPTAAPQGSYVLQNQDGKVAFFKVASDDIMVGANRAYLNASSSSAKVLNFSAEATAIKTIGALTSGKAEVYGANGARQNGLQKGMNIVKMADGSVQKVLVK